MNKIEQGDFYEVLRIRQDATPQEIARAYRTQIQQLGDNKHEQQSFFEELPRSESIALIQEAYDTLSNKEKRVTYDRSLDAEKTPLKNLDPYSKEKRVVACIGSGSHYFARACCFREHDF